MSQVKNLRAMFEQKGDDASSPERGRSPGPHSSDSPRPLSKVRTNFVAIEKDGRMGLQREPSHESSPSRLRVATTTDSEPNTDKGTTEATDPTPELLFTEPRPVLSPTSETSDMDKTSSSPPAEAEAQASAEAKTLAGAVTDEPSLNPDKKAEEERLTAPTPADPPQQTVLNTHEVASDPVAPAGKGPTEQSQARDARGTSSQASTSTRASSRPPTVMTKPTTKTITKPPSTATAGKKPEARPAAKARERTTTRRDGHPKALSTTSRAATTTTSTTIARRAAASRPATDSDPGFVKPKPKSPTKPVSLPGSLMAPTTSSGAKGNGASRQTNTRQTSNLQANTIVGRSPSRVGATSTTKPVKKQPTTANRTRPSVGPPPKKAPEEAPKKDAPVDEGFLARMMRPTQSSSSKTMDKAPATPPRRTKSRPSLASTDTSSRRGSSTKRAGSVKSSRSVGARSVASDNAHATAEDPPVEVATVETVQSAVAIDRAAGDTVKDVTALAKVADLVEAPVTPEQQAANDNLLDSIPQLALEQPITPPAQTESEQQDIPETITVPADLAWEDGTDRVNAAEAQSTDSIESPENPIAEPSMTDSLTIEPETLASKETDAIPITNLN